MKNLRPFELPIDSSGVYSNMCGDFAAAYQAVGTIRCSGLSFTPDVTQLIKVVKLVFATPNYTPVIVPLEVGFSISSGAGYFDIVFNGITDFASSDKYQVFIAGSKKNFDLGANALLTKIINSNPSIPTTLLATGSNISAATNYYPTSSGIQIIRKCKFRLWDFCSSGVTNTVEIFTSSAFTTPISVLGQDVTAGDTKTDWVDSTNKVIDYEGLDQCFVRVKSVTADATNAINLSYDITFDTLL